MGFFCLFVCFKSPYCCVSTQNYCLRVFFYLCRESEGVSNNFWIQFNCFKFVKKKGKELCEDRAQERRVPLVSFVFCSVFICLFVYHSLPLPSESLPGYWLCSSFPDVLREHLQSFFQGGKLRFCLSVIVF